MGKPLAGRALPNGNTRQLRPRQYQLPTDVVELIDLAYFEGRGQRNRSEIVADAVRRALAPAARKAK